MRWRAVLSALAVIFFIAGCASTPKTASKPKVGTVYGDIFKLKWKKYVGEYNWTFTNCPLIFGRYVLYATNGDNGGRKDPYDKLYVFDRDGNLLWSFEGEDGMNGVVASPQFISSISDLSLIPWRLSFPSPG